MWYNSTSGSLKGIAGLEAWISATAMPEQNYGAGAAGTQTALVYFGGSPYDGSPPFPRVNTTLEYNGSGWTSSGAYTGSLNYLGGCGTQTAALGAGGFSSPPAATTTASAEYNGSTWTAGNSMSQQRMNMGANFIGIQTAAAVVGGDQYPSTPRSVSTVEEYDGTNFSSATAYPIVIQNIACAGPQTAGWVAGGQSDINPPTPNTVRNNVNFYDGTNWTASTNLPAATHRAGGCGTQTAALFFGGQLASPTTPLTTAYGFDGTSWTAKPSLSLGRVYIASGGVSTTSTAAIGAGGYDPGPGSTSATEEFHSSTNVITAAAWASGGALPSASMRSAAGAGTQTAGLIAGGYTTTITSEAYLYDGNTWTATVDIPAARSLASGCGTQTAGFSIGGTNPPSTAKAETYIFDGEGWTAAPSLPTATAGAGVFGTTSATAAAGGSTTFGPANAVNASYEYNGSSWTAGENINTARNNLTGFGTQTAGAINNGYIPGGSGYSAATEEYDGTDWTTGTAMIVASSGCKASGASQTDAILFSGRSAANNGEQTTFGYDGTSWSTRPSLANNHYQQGNAGTSSTTTFIAGGGPKGSGTPDNVTTTEEFTPETTAVNSKTLTTS